MKCQKFVPILLLFTVFSSLAVASHASKRSSLLSSKKLKGHLIGYSVPWDWAEQDPTAFANALARIQAIGKAIQES